MGIARQLTDLVQAYYTPQAAPEVPLELLQELTRLEEAEQRIRSAALGMFGEINKSLAGAYGDLISAQAEMKKAGAQVEAAKVEALGSLAIEIAELNSLSPTASDTQVSQARKVGNTYGTAMATRLGQLSADDKQQLTAALQASGATPAQKAAALNGLLGDSLTGPVSLYQDQMNEQGESPMDQRVFAESSRGSVQRESLQALKSLETELGLTEGTLDPATSRHLVVMNLGTVDSALFSSDTPEGREIRARQQQTRQEIENIQKKIGRMGIGTSSPMLTKAVNALEELSTIMNDPTGELLNNKIDTIAETENLDYVREIIKGQIDEIRNFEDPYSKAVHELLTTHEGVPDVLNQLFGVELDGRPMGRRMDRAVSWVIKNPTNFRKSLEAWDAVKDQYGENRMDIYLRDAMNDYEIRGPGLNRKPTDTTPVGVARLESDSLGEDGAARERRADEILGLDEARAEAEAEREDRRRQAQDRRLRESREGESRLPEAEARVATLEEDLIREGILPDEGEQAEQSGLPARTGAVLGAEPGADVKAFMADPESDPRAVEALRKFWGTDDVAYAGSVGAGTYDTARGAKLEEQAVSQDARREESIRRQKEFDDQERTLALSEAKEKTNIEANLLRQRKEQRRENERVRRLGSAYSEEDLANIKGVLPKGIPY